MSQVAASENLIFGTGQKKSKFCGQVIERYVGLIPAQMERSIHLQHALLHLQCRLLVHEKVSPI